MVKGRFVQLSRRMDCHNNLTTSGIIEMEPVDNMYCVLCLHAIHDDVTYGGCKRSCSTKTCYHAKCHAHMVSACQLECAVCRCPSAESSTSMCDDCSLLTFDTVELDGPSNCIIALVILVLSPPLLLVRLLYSTFT